jgi:predicted flap endonuclease-1-like 5' DNA nuclease
LNRYGKGLTEIKIQNWPIPTSIKEEHLGQWQIKIDFSDEIQRLHDEKPNENQILRRYFFVEYIERIEYPLIAGERIYQIPVSVSSSDLVSSSIEPKKPVIAEEIETIDEDILIAPEPVTTIRGIGKAYANRLVSIKVFTVEDFWNYSDRVHLAEVMRISDTRVEKMLNDAQILLSEKADLLARSEIELTEEFVPDDLSTVDGISKSALLRLKKIGIKSKTDLLDFPDLDLLRTTCKVTKSQFKSIMASIGRILEPEKVKKPVKLSPYDELVIEVKGIGSVTMKKLNSVGVITVKDLLNSSYSVVKPVTTIKTYNKWIKNASLYVGVEKPEVEIDVDEGTSSVTLISLPGIGMKTLSKLNNNNIHTIEDLKTYSDKNGLRKILRMSELRFTKFMNSL